MTNWWSVPVMAVAVALAAGPAGAAMAPMPFALEAAQPARAAANKERIEKKEKSEIVLRVDVDGETETLRLEDLKAGETREVRTESGKKALVTKKGSGISLRIDGKDVPIQTHEIRAASRKNSGDCCGMCCKGGERIARMMSSCSRGGHARRACDRMMEGLSMMFEMEMDDDEADDDRPMGMADGMRMGGHPGCGGSHGGGETVEIERRKIDVDKLESLKGLDDKTKAAVKAALAEIESSEPKIIRKEVRRRMGGGSGVERRVIVRSDGDDDADSDGDGK